MKKFLVIKRTDNADYFHSVIKAESLDNAAEIFEESSEYDHLTTYFIYPLVDYSFNENNRIIVPPNTKMKIIRAFKLGD
ncbi:hypothetical protein [Alkalihalobacillus sp. BA299]|uniref:hypothetical protein n=1 Tax=Alkalihalobacillus sp. BA299 TaxID=2815938 RepID=UPI001ADC78E0|nr:hypothetical protein [Alkalihalobacillus sp. BA299]